ncbi:DNA mismatch repair endonuclease MutL [Falsigemmobacter faecalis]|uniref:DNA mismatch repair protein MutL n=1 Tax=Falsigemmobacter faecalis TaxID=2488730 RepID=A0A3P3DUP2_9RHOB|nr:DNA mismatch repair endonuclease MutL [Falsigemmobacter faecalis]RRH77885.1 DNA mismatch repair endonuclease MutL [Falsigemmobacter faecalis]
MDQTLPQMRPVIRQLDESAINRIAAGEVVERPASAIKELVENALDAGAKRVDVAYAQGGKSLIRVIDDGCGMTPEDLPLALSRHATSKIDGQDLLNIHTFGFRGEALPSLGAVGRLSITSRAEGNEAAVITVSGGRMEPVRPAALNRGTVVELRDLFYATPARLKFLRSDRAEAMAISDVMKRLAMAEPGVSFTLRDVSDGGEGRLIFRADAEQGDLFDALRGRLARIIGADFTENALPIDATRDGVRLTGYAALPTWSRGTAVAQFLFVNGRPVLDRMLFGALRAAYQDLLSRDRHAGAVLFLDCDPQLVDVNVHPAKSEVRFRDPALTRGLIVSALRHALAAEGHRSSNTVAEATLSAMRPEAPAQAPLSGAASWTTSPAARVWQMDRPSQGALRSSFAFQAPDPGLSEMPSARFEPAPSPEVAEDLSRRPLGAARAQVHENYIIAQTETGMVIVDQHAAHERLVYERLKRQAAVKGIAAQALLIPDIIELAQDEAAMLLEFAPELEKLGLVLEAFGGSAIAVRETPAILGQVNSQGLIRDILDELTDQGSTTALQVRIDAILSRMACHGSVRSGRQMRAEEMNALLREMEATPHSGQCNHGRPTYVELRLSDIERLFGRT